MPSDLAFVGGVFVATNYAAWSVRIFSGPVAAGTGAIFNLTNAVVTLRDGKQIMPFAVGAPITIGNGANQESVNVTALTGCFNGAQPGSPTVAATTSNAHGQGDLITSGSGGLFEACLDASNRGGGTVAIGPDWQGTSANITAAQALYPTVVIDDLRAGGEAAGNFRATLDTPTQPTYRLVDSELKLAAAVTSVNGSVAAIRGNLTALAGGAITGASYLYGVQGKLTLQGHFTGSAEVSCGVLGQLDLSSSQSLTAPVAAIWGDCGASVGTATGANIDIAVLYNTISTLKINSAIRIYVYSSYLFDLTDAGSNWVVGTTAATAAGCLKILVGGSVRYLQLYSAES